MIHEWCAIIYGLGNCIRHTLYCDSFVSKLYSIHCRKIMIVISAELYC